LSLPGHRPKTSCSATTAGEARGRGGAVFYADNLRSGEREAPGGKPPGIG